jgi:hypothetical protein
MGGRKYQINWNYDFRSPHLNKTASCIQKSLRTYNKHSLAVAAANATTVGSERTVWIDNFEKSKCYSLQAVHHNCAMGMLLFVFLILPGLLFTVSHLRRKPAVVIPVSADEANEEGLDCGLK